MSEPAIQPETHASRAPVPAPEGCDEAADGERKPPPPPPEAAEAPKVPHPEPALMPSPVEAPSQAPQLVSAKEDPTLLPTEQKLAAFLHYHLSPAMIEGVDLNLVKMVGADGKLTLRLDLSGDGVAAKADDLIEKVMELIERHPAFAGVEVEGAGQTRSPATDNAQHTVHVLAEGLIPETFLAACKSIEAHNGKTLLAPRPEETVKGIPAAAEAANDNAEETSAIPENTIAAVGEHTAPPAKEPEPTKTARAM